MKKEDLKALGLSEGQMRGDDFAHNSGWYDSEGAKIGWGDLSQADFKRIQAALKEGDQFIILSESDSFWAFAKKVNGPAFLADHGFKVNNAKGEAVDPVETEPTMHNPGKNYVQEKARFVIRKDVILHVGYDFDDDRPLEPPSKWRDLLITPIRRADFKL